jgi:c-di-GMP-binding flagellar brake protein YcgR
MDKNLAAPESDTRFSVRHTAEIEGILRGIMENKALVTLQTPDGREFLVTTLVAVDAPAAAVFLGIGDEAGKNEVLLAAPTITLSTFHDRIRVRWSSDKLEMVTSDRGPLFRIPFPVELKRFQRREYYRLLTSLTNPIKCQIPTPQGDIDTAVVDISVGGIGILAYATGVSINPGETYHGCRLSMPDGGAFLVSLSVRSTYDVTLKNGTISHRAGCQFINLPVSIESEIQRYIFRMERDRRHSI